MTSVGRKLARGPARDALIEAGKEYTRLINIRVYSRCTHCGRLYDNAGDIGSDCIAMLSRDKTCGGTVLALTNCPAAIEAVTWLSQFVPLGSISSKGMNGVRTWKWLWNGDIHQGPDQAVIQFCAALKQEQNGTIR